MGAGVGVERACFGGVWVWVSKDSLVVDVGGWVLLVFSGYLFAGDLEVYVVEARRQDGILFYVTDGKSRFYGLSVYGWDGDRWVGLKREACEELAEFLKRLSQVHRGLREEIDRVAADCRKLAKK